MISADASLSATQQRATDDGRRLRRDRNRDTVVDAMLKLYREGNLAPSSDEIAERAGLSSRSLFRYFDDIDDLCRAAISRHLLRVLPAVDIRVDAGASVATRIAAVVEQRVLLFDAIGTVGQVSRLRAHFQPVIAEQLSEARAFLRTQLDQLFVDELTAMGTTRAGSVLAAADVLTSFEAYQLLRNDQQLSRIQAADVLANSLSALLVGGPSHLQSTDAQVR